MIANWYVVGLVAFAAFGWTFAADARHDDDLVGFAVGLWVLVAALAILNVVYPLYLLRAP